MSDQPKNLSASIHDRLANEARRTGRTFGEILQYYGMERFLYRLSKTRHAGDGLQFVEEGEEVHAVFSGW